MQCYSRLVQWSNVAIDSFPGHSHRQDLHTASDQIGTGGRNGLGMDTFTSKGLKAHQTGDLCPGVMVGLVPFWIERMLSGLDWWNRNAETRTGGREYEAI